MSKPDLTIDILTKEAKVFAIAESGHAEPTLFGKDSGKKVGTYFEKKLREFLADRYEFELGSPDEGIDFPGLNVDVKLTLVEKAQSSCPYDSARQKIYGLGYSLLVFVYERIEDYTAKTGRLNILHVIFVDARRTGDFQLTSELRKILDNDGNTDDLIACMRNKNLPVEEIEAARLSAEILKNKPEQGYLTISNALQWRLYYQHVIEVAGTVDGIERVQ